MNNDLDRHYYRETVQDSGMGEGKIIRQRNGVGVYAHTSVMVYALAQGQGIRVTWEAGDSIPPRFASAVIDGVRDAMNTGVLAGMELIDVHAAVVGGSYHDVDSTAESFREAARQGTFEALLRAKPVLLEAVAHITAVVSAELLSTIEESVVSLGGRVIKPQPGDQISAVEAHVPACRASEMVAKILGATVGHSIISVEYDGFEIKREPPDTVEQWVRVN